MSKIVDLSVLIKEPLIFKDIRGDEYKIEGSISTEFVIKLTKYAEDIRKLRNEADALGKMKELVIDILNMDKTKKVDMDLINERFDDIRFLKIIIQEMMKHVQDIANDPNS